MTYVCAIFLLLPYGRVLATYIRNHGVMTKGVHIVLAGLVLFFLVRIWHVLERNILHAVFLFSLVGAVLAGMYFYLKLPEERLHFFEYGLLGYLCGWMLEARGHLSSTKRGSVMGFAIVLAIGVMDEVVQGILPMRVFDYHDIFWNTASSWTGFWIFHASRG